MRGQVVPGNRWDLADTDPSRPPRVSVVVTHYEQPVELARTLRALARQTHPADRLEVVVADDGSRERPAVPPGVRLVAQPHAGFGAARARNLGAAAAGGDVLVFLDADTTPEPDYVRRLTRLPALLPEALVVGRRRHADLAACPPDVDVEVVGPQRELAEPAWLRDAHRRTRDLLDADETAFRFVIAAVACCSAELFTLTGGFDETFSAYGGEDWEWAHRAWTHGALLAHEPTAVAWHDGPDRADRAGWTTTDDEGRRRLREETLAVARRVPVPGVGARGLLGGPGDPVVGLAADLADDALVITVDSLLAALPRAAVVVSAAQAATLPADPRIVVHEGDPLASRAGRSAWRHLHVARALTGDAAAWSSGAELLAGPGGAGWVDVRLPGIVEPVLVWSTLRARRRATRWERELDPHVAVEGSLRPVDAATTLQAHWGGWA